MDTSAEVRVSGMLFHSFARACVNLELIVGDELPTFLERIDPMGFGTVARFTETMELIVTRFVEPGPILERIGEEMMRGWYELGPGKGLIARGVDFLHFQASSAGYRSVVVGAPEQVGRFDLEHIDPTAGRATLYSDTLFPRDLDRGVLRGGLSLTGDVIYAEVTPRPGSRRIDVHFVTDDAAAPLSPNERLRWRLRALESARVRDRAYWTATNKTLARTLTRLRETEQALRDNNAELEQNYEALQRSRDELLRLNQRAEQMFCAYAEILPGAVLNGKYEVHHKIGAGGYGLVFHGRDLNLEREVAIKIFKTPVDGFDPTTMERFHREGASACRVNHPNAVSIFDSGVSVGGIPYLVMELLEGLTLAELFQLGRGFAPRSTLALLRPVAEVLASVHAVGIVHRDIKPANIFLDCSRGALQVKVLDFGIAKLLDEPERGELTRTGSLLGTPNYISPERLCSRSYDGRADTYSLGVIAYRMLAGVAPFTNGEGQWVGLLESLAAAPPPLRRVAPHVPVALTRLVMRLLEADPRRRPCASQLAHELRELELALAGAERPPSQLYEQVIHARKTKAARAREGITDDTPLATGRTLDSPPS